MELDVFLLMIKIINPLLFILNSSRLIEIICIY